VKVRDELILLYGIFMVTSSSFIVLDATDNGIPINRVLLAFSRVLFTGSISLLFLSKQTRKHSVEENQVNFFTKHPTISICLAGVSLAAHFAWFFLSLDFLPVGISLSLTNTAPLWMLMLSIIVFKEHPRFIDWIAILSAIVGIGILGSKNLNLNGSWSDYTIGVFYSLASGFVLAIYLILARHGVRKMGLWRYFGLVNISSAGSLLLYIVITDTFVQISLATLWYGLLLAIFPGLMGHAAFQYSMSKLPTPLVGAATIGEPVLGTILAFIFLGQYLVFSDVLGIVITLFALSIVAYTNQQKN